MVTLEKSNFCFWKLIFYWQDSTEIENDINDLNNVHFSPVLIDAFFSFTFAHYYEGSYKRIFSSIEFFELGEKEPVKKYLVYLAKIVQLLNNFLVKSQKLNLIRFPKPAIPSDLIYLWPSSKDVLFAPSTERPGSLLPVIVKVL